MIDISEVLQRLAPGAQFTVRQQGDNYEIDWYSEEIKQPSDAAINECCAIMEKEAKAAKQAADEAAKHRQSAMAKLKKLGLTDDEIAALGK